MGSLESEPYEKPTPESVRSRLAAAGFTVPDDFVDDIIENLMVLHAHARTVRRLPLEERHELTPDYI